MGTEMETLHPAVSITGTTPENVQNNSTTKLARTKPQPLSHLVRAAEVNHGTMSEVTKQTLPQTEDTGSEGTAEVIKVCPSAEQLHWKEAPTRLYCPARECRLVFKTQGGLTKHTNACHPEHKANGGGEGKEFHFHCPEAGCRFNSDFDRWLMSFAQLKAHYVNTHEKKFTCSMCGKGFGLDRDRAYHEKDCGTVFACGVCPCHYPSRQALLTHCARKQHPLPEKYRLPKKSNESKTAASSSQSASVEGSRAKGQGTGGKCSQPHLVTASGNEEMELKVKSSGSPDKAKTKTPCSPRRILPKCPVILAPSLPVALARRVIVNSQGGRSLAHTSCVEIQTDASGIGRLPQRVNVHGVSTGCQTVKNSTGVGQQVNTATQVSATQSRSPTCSSQISDMATQVSGIVFGMVQGSRITHTAIQTSVDKTNSSTQLTGDISLGYDFGAVNRSAQATAVLVNSATQMDLNPQLCAVAVQTNVGTDVTNMAVQATSHIPDFAHIATQATSGEPDVFDISTQVSGALIDPNFPGMMVNPNLVQPPAINTATQATLPYTALNKRNTTNTTGTQMAVGVGSDESETATTGMQTSLSLIPGRSKFGVIAQTQTLGDHILRSAMATADIPVVRSPGRAKGRSPGRKRNMKSSEAQTQAYIQRAKKRRRKQGRLAEEAHPGGVQDLSIATQTVASISPKPTPRPSSSLGMYQNPTLSASASREEESETWDPFLSAPSPPHISTSDTGLQADLDEFLSTYTADFGVQTQDDFLAVCTAEFGVQTSDFSVGGGTADFGVQTIASSLGSLLEDIECGMQYGGSTENTAGMGNPLESTQVSTSSKVSGYSSMVHCGTGTDVSTLDCQTQTIKPVTSETGYSLESCFAEMGTEMDSSLSGFPNPLNPKLFDSFDSELSFSDCATGTEDFFASSHTQTSVGNVASVVKESSISPVMSIDSAVGTDDIFSEIHTQTGLGIQEDLEAGASDRFVESFLSQSAQTDDTNQTQAYSDSATGWDSLHSQAAETSHTTISTSLSATDFSAVAATDTQTQTADDLLDFLMNNMETQTTEDLPDSNLLVADTQTQTSGILLTPPHALSPAPGTSFSPFNNNDATSLVTTETQTCSQFLPEFDEDDEDELFHISDMQTQTSLLDSPVHDDQDFHITDMQEQTSTLHLLVD
ncbi:serine-rich adhesin for platelets-like [Littorina saxatilis]|uniref:C2H2-type domain-containing protein n=1 Tax=Littorina saxatilis TaxID=31220 RepID=A0AAN9C1A0_9CAEN